MTRATGLSSLRPRVLRNFKHRGTTADLRPIVLINDATVTVMHVRSSKADTQRCRAGHFPRVDQNR